MKRSRVWGAFLLVLFVLVAPVWGQQDIGPAMPAWADPTAPKPPAQVLKTLRPRAIWLRWEPQTLGKERVWVLVSVVPVARNKYSPEAPPAGTNPPITRKDVYEGMALEPSPFYVDVWSDKGKRWTKLQTATYRDEADVANIRVKYLRPREKTGPVLLIEGGFTHWKQWVLVGFPDGVRGKRVFTQQFLWGGEGEIYTEQTFEKTDERGFLQVDERNKSDEAAKEERRVYTWDGNRFVDKQARYFVIAATTKTRSEAEEFVRRRNLQGEAEVYSTNAFSRLTPKMYVVVVKRTRTLSEANGYAKGYKSLVPDTFVKQAF